MTGQFNVLLDNTHNQDCRTVRSADFCLSSSGLRAGERNKKKTTACSSSAPSLPLSVRDVYLLTSPLFNQRPAPSQLEFDSNWKPISGFPPPPTCFPPCPTRPGLEG